MINIMYAVDPIKRIVKPMSGHAVTEQDHEASSLRFAFPDNIAGTGLDSTGTAVRVMYIRPDGGDPVAKTLTFYKHSGGYYLYDWDLQKSDLSKEGTLTFSLCVFAVADGVVSVKWHTTPCQISVLNTIHTDDSDEGDETITPTVAERVAVLETMIQRVASGAPIVVSSTSAMADTNQIYVLSTDRKWYYHNGTTWVSGGTYGAVATDTTLTQSGAPADAKVVGDEIADLKSDLKEELSQVVSLNLIGMDASALYPVYIEAGTKVTFSTADGSTFAANYRIYYYDTYGTVIDWFSLSPSHGSKRTFTFNQNIYWLSWQSGVAPSVNIMANFGETKASYVPYQYPSHSFAYKGNVEEHAANHHLADIRRSGWYAGNAVNNYDDLPVGITNGPFQLRVYEKGYSNGTVLQEIITNREERFGRSLSLNGVSNGWQKQASEKSNIRTLDLLNNRIVSMNGNYFDYDSVDWQYGIYNSQTGVVSGSLPYKYAIVPLQGPGDYVKIGSKNTFGNNFVYFALLDKNKNFIGSIQGTPIPLDTKEKYTSKVTISEDLFATVKYTVVHMSESEGFVPKLYYDTSDIFITEYKLPQKYGFTTDPIYKKVLVCDGDSICEGVRDLPRQFGSWHGRFKRTYQILGTNYAIGGGTICDKTDTTVGGNPRHSVVINIDTIYTNYPELDYLILEGGTNDADLIGRFTNDMPPEGFGTWSETDFSGNYDNKTFCGALDELFYKAVSYWPHAKIGFIIAMEMGTNNATIANRKRYFDEAVKIAKKWHIPVLNLWDNSGADARVISFYDSTKDGAENVAAGSFYYDGQHPTSYGYDKMQPMIEAWVKAL